MKQGEGDSLREAAGPPNSSPRRTLTVTTEMDFPSSQCTGLGSQNPGIAFVTPTSRLMGSQGVKLPCVILSFCYYSS